MEKPPVFHICRARGRVSNVLVAGQKIPTCEACHQRITDPMELTPRGSGFTKQRDDTLTTARVDHA